MRIALCDDDEAQREKLKAAVDRHLVSHGYRPRYEEYSGGGPLVAEVAAGTDPFDLVFLDPPYRMEAAYGDALTRLRAAGRLAPGALAILERAEARAISLPEGFSLRDARRYGETCVEFVVEGEEA